MARIEINNLRVEVGAGYFVRWEDDQGRRLHLTLAIKDHQLVRPLAVATTDKMWSRNQGQWLYRNDPEDTPKRLQKRCQIMEAFNKANGPTVTEALRRVEVEKMVEAAIQRDLERKAERERADHEKRTREIRDKLQERHDRGETKNSAREMFEQLLIRSDDDLLELYSAFR